MAAAGSESSDSSDDNLESVHSGLGDYSGYSAQDDTGKYNDSPGLNPST